MLGQICVKTEETPEYFLPTHVLINCGQKVLVAKCTIFPQVPDKGGKCYLHWLAVGTEHLSLNELGTTVLNTGDTMFETEQPTAK